MTSERSGLYETTSLQHANHIILKDNLFDSSVFCSIEFSPRQQAGNEDNDILDSINNNYAAIGLRSSEYIARSI